MTYDLIYADPPWPYRVWSKKGQGRSAEHHYPTMNLAEIQALDIRVLAAPDCALALWVTAPNLKQGIETLACWGFDYKTVLFTWVKRNRRNPLTWFWGLGHYTRANAEFVLLGTRGRGLPRVSRRVHSLIEAPITRHSAKPPEARDRLVALFGDRPRIELFARERAPGWDATGLDLDGRDIRDVLTAAREGVR
ncbi:MAG TPA: MT-A70 family methyltransferase [Armatimonadota bacterium]|nr:DNA methyltransferase [Armatimonadota bacterium]HPT97741.1 MT-A70 family methyltransferase [Armatimonadota bacterium]